MYCYSKEAWLFINVTTDQNGNGDLCSRYLVKSLSTQTFDVTDIASGPWLAPDPARDADVTVDWLFLACRDCEKESTLCPSDHGTCENHMCQCKTGYIGLDCDIKTDESCQVLEGVRSDSAAKSQSRQYSRGIFFYGSYPVLHYNDTMDWIQVNHRPVLVQEQDDEVHIVLFTGRRWTIFAFESDSLVASRVSRDKIISYFTSVGDQDNDSISILQSLSKWRLRPIFFSEAIDYGNPSFDPTPIGLDWFHARPRHNTANNDPTFAWQADFRRPVDGSFQCGQCDSVKYPCFNGGFCSDRFSSWQTGTSNRTKGTCRCVNFYSGSHCEDEPRCRKDSDCHGPTSRCNQATGICDCGEKNGKKSRGGNLCQFHQSESIIECGNNQPCFNGGKCLIDGGLAFCICPGSYHGPQCQYIVLANHTEDCGSVECQNGGSCIYTNFTEPSGLCRCRDPFYGHQCQFQKQKDNPSACFNIICRNGGTCNYDARSQHDLCICPESYHGDFCELEKSIDDEL